MLEKVRADPELCSYPDILLTSLTERVHFRQGMSCGADDYLTKSFYPAGTARSGQCTAEQTGTR